MQARSRLMLQRWAGYQRSSSSSRGCSSWMPLQSASALAAKPATATTTAAAAGASGSQCRWMSSAGKDSDGEKAENWKQDSHKLRAMSAQQRNKELEAAAMKYNCRYYYKDPVPLLVATYLPVWVDRLPQHVMVTGQELELMAFAAAAYKDCPHQLAHDPGYRARFLSDAKNCNYDCTRTTFVPRVLLQIGTKEAIGYAHDLLDQLVAQATHAHDTDLGDVDRDDHDQRTSTLVDSRRRKRDSIDEFLEDVEMMYALQHHPNIFEWPIPSLDIHNFHDVITSNVPSVYDSLWSTREAKHLLLGDHKPAARRPSQNASPAMRAHLVMQDWIETEQAAAQDAASQGLHMVGGSAPGTEQLHETMLKMATHGAAGSEDYAHQFLQATAASDKMTEDLMPDMAVSHVLGNQFPAVMPIPVAEPEALHANLSTRLTVEITTSIVAGYSGNFYATGSPEGILAILELSRGLRVLVDSPHWDTLSGSLATSHAGAGHIVDAAVAAIIGDMTPDNVLANLHLYTAHTAFQVLMSLVRQHTVAAQVVADVLCNPIGDASDQLFQIVLVPEMAGSAL